MKKRLTRVYDTMTMPQDCSDRIEKTLRQEMSRRRTGRYTKTVAPTPRRQGWYMAAAAVCLVLVLAAGGTTLLLNMTDRTAIPMVTKEENPLETAIPEETPEDFYQVATNLPARQVEAFAETVRDAIGAGKWGELSNLLQYPITIDGDPVSTREEFLALLYSKYCDPESLEAIRNESCRKMFCNWQGISMGTGQVWIGEFSGELKVIALNGLFQEGAVRDADTVEKRQVFQAFLDILQDNGTFYDREFGGVFTLREYCEAYGKTDDFTAEVSKFTMADMDSDGIPELILQLKRNGVMETRKLVLRHGQGTTVYAFPFENDRMGGIRKDGTYGPWPDEIAYEGWARLVFPEDSVCETQFLETPSEVPLAQWHQYPCDRVDVVLASYEHAFVGENRMPGNQFSLFEELILGRMENEWSVIRKHLNLTGLNWQLDEGTVDIFDPNTPGTWMYGVLANVDGYSRFGEVGYYVCTESGEYQAEVRHLLSDKPEYLVDVSLLSEGKTVASAEAVLEYFARDDEILNSGGARDAKQISAMVEEFTMFFFAKDITNMKEYLSSDFRGQLYGYDKPGEATIISCRGLPIRPMALEDTISVTVTLLEPGVTDSYSYLSMELIKQSDGWKVLFYGLEK